MIARMADIERKFPLESELKSRACDVDFDFELMLNSDVMLKELRKLQYKQVKVPNAPSFLVEECLSGGGNNGGDGGSRNSENEAKTAVVDPVIVLSWHHQKLSSNVTTTSLTTSNNKMSISSSRDVHGYVLEVDEGTPESAFKQVYCGPDTICQINGLEPNKVYNARVKAFNQAGFSDYSQVISIPSTPSMIFISFLNLNTVKCCKLPILTKTIKFILVFVEILLTKTMFLWYKKELFLNIR